MTDTIIPRQKHEQQQSQVLSNSNDLSNPNITVSKNFKPKHKLAILTEQALTHYDTKRDMGIEGRQVGRILFLRGFNNWAKSTLIKTYTKRGASVLDLCCGKGGDLNKWRLSEIGHYVGMDIAEHAIVHAVERFKKYEPKDIFPAIFVKKADVSDPQLDINYIIPHNIKFDIVSCQMSMHYVFNSLESVKAFLNIVTARLVPGGYFIGTVPDSNVLVKKCRNTRISKDAEYGKMRMFTFGNNLFSAMIPQKRFSKEMPFGIKYYFYLEDAVGRKDESKIVYVPEYLVVFNKFVELAKEYDLELIESRNFHEYYVENMKKLGARKMFHKMVKTKENDTDKELKEQWDVIHLYKAFAFRKKGESTGKVCGNCGSKEHIKIVNAKGWD